MHFRHGDKYQRLLQLIVPFCVCVQLGMPEVPKISLHIFAISPEKHEK